MSIREPDGQPGRRFTGMLSSFVNWLLNAARHRAEPLAELFPEEWRSILAQSIPFYSRLPTEADREQLQRDIVRFVAEKSWTPFDVEIDDRKRVVIAAHACLLLNRRLDLGLYPRTLEIILRSGTFGPQTQSRSPDGHLFESVEDRIGEAWYRGPIVLSWGAIEALIQDHDPHQNVIIHEFAHALDHLDGISDGTPPLESGRELSEWADVFTHEYQRLRQLASDGRFQDIDPYAATNPAEFFAVVTEQFFCRGAALRRQHLDLYGQLELFFRQDPANWKN